MSHNTSSFTTPVTSSRVLRLRWGPQVTFVNELRTEYVARIVTFIAKLTYFNTEVDREPASFITQLFLFCKMFISLLVLTSISKSSETTRGKAKICLAYKNL